MGGINLLNSLEIKNFQSHKYTKLKFIKGINVIVGNSTSGKTAIFRAFQWLLLNRPLGNRFKSVFANDNDKVCVSAEFDEKFVSIEKDKETVYSVGTNSFDISDSFKGIGSDVPDTVKQVLNLNDINIQNQLDQHFLITSSPGEVARTINKIIHLDNIDNWVSNLTAKINGINKQIKLKEDDSEKLVSELSSIPDTDAFEKDISKCEYLQSEISSLKFKIESLEYISAKVSSLEKEELILKEWLDIQKHISSLQLIHEEIIAVKNECEIIDNFISISQGMENLSEWQSDLSRDIKECSQINANISRLSQEVGELYKIVNGYEIIVKEMEEKNKILSQVKQKYDEYKKQLVKSDVCPLCSSKITKEKMSEISTYF